MIKCNKCKVEKEKRCFYDRRKTCSECFKKQRTDRYHNSSKEKELAYMHARYIPKPRTPLTEAEREASKIRSKKNRIEYNVKNKEKIQRQIYDLRKIRLEKNPLFKLRLKISAVTYQAVKHRKYTEKSKTTLSIIGCSAKVLERHFEKQFKDGMNWNNHGDWEIDHIIALATAKTERQMMKLAHYKNLQPLWKKENQRKGKY